MNIFLYLLGLYTENITKIEFVRQITVRTPIPNLNEMRPVVLELKHEGKET
jgi:hypothetical protein